MPSTSSRPTRTGRELALRGQVVEAAGIEGEQRRGRRLGRCCERAPDRAGGRRPRGRRPALDCRREVAAHPHPWRGLLGRSPLRQDDQALIRYGPDPVVAILDSQRTGESHEGIPIVATVENSMPFEPTVAVVGVATQGGRFPSAWRDLLKETIAAGLDVESGLHEFVSDDTGAHHVARLVHGVELRDLRKPPKGLNVPTGANLDVDAKIVLTVGSDCAIGKDGRGRARPRGSQARPCVTRADGPDGHRDRGMGHRSRRGRRRLPRRSRRMARRRGGSARRRAARGKRLARSPDVLGRDARVVHGSAHTSSSAAPGRRRSRGSGTPDSPAPGARRAARAHRAPRAEGRRWRASR